MTKMKHKMIIEFSAVMAQDVNFYEIARKHLIKGLAKEAAKKI